MYITHCLVLFHSLSFLPLSLSQIYSTNDGTYTCTHTHTLYICILLDTKPFPDTFVCLQIKGFECRKFPPKKIWCSRPWNEPMEIDYFAVCKEDMTHIIKLSTTIILVLNGSSLLVFSFLYPMIATEDGLVATIW